MGLASLAARWIRKWRAEDASSWLHYLGSGLSWDPAFRKKTEKAFESFPWERPEFAGEGERLLRSLLGNFLDPVSGPGPGESMEEMFLAGIRRRGKRKGAEMFGPGSALSPGRYADGQARFGRGAKVGAGKHWPEGKSLEETLREEMARMEEKLLRGCAEKAKEPAGEKRRARGI